MANRLYQAMELAAIGSIPKLSRRTGIDRGYLYRLANGEIRTPHKYLDTLSEAMGVNPLWLGTGSGGPYDHERPQSVQGSFCRTVTIVPTEGEIYDIDVAVPNIFTSQRHVPTSPDLYRYFYIPEMNEYFPGYTLLTVEKEPRPGPGLFAAWINRDGRKRLVSFLTYYQGMDCIVAKDPDMEVIGRVRNMDYWKIDQAEEAIRK